MHKLLKQSQWRQQLRISTPAMLEDGRRSHGRHAHSSQTKPVATTATNQHPFNAGIWTYEPLAACTHFFNKAHGNTSFESAPPRCWNMDVEATGGMHKLFKQNQWQQQLRISTTSMLEYGRRSHGRHAHTS
jgi:hypothetical protein